MRKGDNQHPTARSFSYRSCHPLEQNVTHPSPVETRDVTISVPIHLISAFELQAQEFLQTSDNGESVGQRAAEVRAHDHDQGMDSLAALVVAAEGHTGQSPTRHAN